MASERRITWRAEQPVAPVGADASTAPGADTRWAMPFGSFAFSVAADRYFGNSFRRDNDDDDEMHGALEKIQTWPFRKWDLHFDGHAIKPKWTWKDRKLVLNIKIQL